jgi:tetratricopeptide (TPR) repeat protein
VAAAVEDLERAIRLRGKARGPSPLKVPDPSPLLLRLDLAAVRLWMDRPRAHQDFLRIVKADEDALELATAALGGYGGHWGTNHLLEMLKEQSREAVHRGAEDWRTPYHLRGLCSIHSINCGIARDSFLKEFIRLTQAAPPGECHPWLVLAVLHEHAQDWTRAEAAYSEALRRRPKLASAWQARGVLRAARLGRPRDAVADLSRAIELDPTEPGRWYHRGRTRAALGEREAARADRNKALELLPGEWQVLGERGCLYFGLRQWQAALADFNAALDTAGGYGGAAYLWIARGDVRAELGDWDGASADFRTAAELPPRTPTEPLDALACVALARLAAGDAAGYRLACQGLLSRAGKEGDVSAVQVWACVLRPGSVEAPARVVRLAERLVANNPGDPSSREALAAALYRAGQPADAFDRLRGVSRLQRNGGGLAARLFLAMALHRQGKTDEARQVLAAAVTILDRDEAAGARNSSAGDRRPWYARAGLAALRREAEAMLRPTGH